MWDFFATVLMLIGAAVVLLVCFVTLMVLTGRIGFIVQTARVSRIDDDDDDSLGV